MSAELTIGFLGAGKMATALARGFIQAKLVGANQIIASDLVDAARASFARETGGKTTPSNLEVLESAGVLLLAVKPDQVAAVLDEIRGKFGGEHLLISIAAGLPRDVATQLAAQTLFGTARMVLETGRHPGELKDMVTSPGGTTIDGIHELEKSGVRGALINAVRAATEKSRKLGQG